MESKDREESNGLKGSKTSTSSVISNPEERLKSSSTSSTSSSLSSEFAFEDPLPADKFETGEEPLPKQGFQQPTALQPDSGSLSPDGSTLQSPPVQVMERASDGSGGYRIPSHVFSRNKSGTGMEWSTASNESLFSIHTGNMSFTGDQFTWLMKSGELNPAEFSKPGDLPKSGQLQSPRADPSKSSAEQVASTCTSPAKGSPALKEDQSPAKKANDFAPAATDLGGAQTSPAMTKKEELKVETKDQNSAKPSFSDDAPPLSARHSDSSGQSFAFPVLTVEGDRASSVTMGTDVTEQQQKNGKEEPPAEASKAAAAAAATTEATTQSSSWFPCLSCCQCHS
ncbi:hypothetical protein Dimus_024023 [Dionaea muscipula]